MTDIQRKIYDYFNREPNLKVLFIFNRQWIEGDLEATTWEDGYRYVPFQGDWFTTKYNLDNDWKDDKVILSFASVSPLEDSSLLPNFPLLDLLCANMEFHSQDSAAFIQQHNIPTVDRTLVRFIETNVMHLQTDKMNRLLGSYYEDGSVSMDVMARAFICSYLGSQRILDWDSIMIRIILLGRESEDKKRSDFFVRLRGNRDVADILSQKFMDILGVTYDDNSDLKITEIVNSFKYNAITQNLVRISADNYKKYKIGNSLALQQMNRILELALSQDKTAKAFTDVLDTVGDGIRNSDIITWYGPDADYYFVPEGLCIPIIKTLVESKIESEPTAVISRLANLLVKNKEEGSVAAAISFCSLVAKYYETVAGFGSLTLNSSDEYLQKYQSDFYIADQIYRQVQETYYNLDPSSALFDTMQTLKVNLDLNYSKFANRLNLEWMRCVKDTGGIKGTSLLKQDDFFSEMINPIQKKVAVIVSDALRYEVAMELISELARSRHMATMKAAVAMLPTETKYCKPSLLPHRTLKLTTAGGTCNMEVDDKVLSSTALRSAHVADYKENAICVSFDTVAEYKQEKNREIFKHPLVIIFHDNIDQIGHDGTSKQIAQACRDTIRDIATMIPKIHATYNVTEVYITSDHGFLFNDIEFQDKDKHTVTEDALEKCSRYYLTSSDAPVSGITKFPLDEVSGMSNPDGIFVAVPDGTNRLAAPSGGYRFTHGGASLQELVIPIIVSKSEREDNKQPVDVILLDRNLSIQASRLRFKLLQTESVSMNRKERHIQVALYHNDNPVSPVADFILDKTDPSLENRKIQVDLTLNRNVDAKVLQLKVYDASDPLNPLFTENVTNSTLIQNDFDF